MPSPLPLRSEWPSSSMLRLSRILTEGFTCAMVPSALRNDDLVERIGCEIALAIGRHGIGARQEYTERALRIDRGDLDTEGHAGHDVHVAGIRPYLVDRDIGRRRDQVQAVRDDRAG